MSFLFKSSKQKNPNPNALPPATRDIRSADGTPTGSSSQIPTLNGMVNGAVKPVSPTPGSSVNNSLNSLAVNEQIGRPSNGTGSVRHSEERPAFSAEDARATGSPSPEQKSIRSLGPDATVYLIAREERIWILTSCDSHAKDHQRQHDQLETHHHIRGL